MNKIMLCLLTVAMLFSENLVAKTLHIYQDPVPIGNYVDDLEGLLTRASAQNGWTYTHADGKRLSKIVHKTYHITVEMLVDEQGVAVSFVDASRPDCTKKSCKVDMDKVNGWLVRLRRNIAYELTLLVRDDALKKTIY
ncbi:hypothetical protein [Shewanella gaetbuli]